MFSRCWLFFALVLVVFIGSSCRTTNDNPPVRQTLDNRAASVECVSLLGRSLHSRTDSEQTQKLKADLAAARNALAEDPTDAERVVWVGRRLGYLWRMNDAIEVFTQGIKDHPNYAPLYRHRGHRYLSLRRFDEAIADLQRAATLIEGKPAEIELDGMPNARNIPLTTTAFNVWYHLGLAHYFKGDYEAALAALQQTMAVAQRYDDNKVATSDWMYMTLRKLGRDSQAASLLESITPDMEIIENRAYHRRLLMYKGLLSPTALLDLQRATELDLATLGYGVGNRYLLNGKKDKAREIFERTTNSPYWPAFGFIASEVDLARMGKPSP